MQKLIFTTTLLLIAIVGISQNFVGNAEDIKQIQDKAANFSTYIINGDVESIGQSYTLDAKIFAGNRDIIQGREDIESYWMPRKEYKTTRHVLASHEIKVIGDEAYDYGVYEGTSQGPEGEQFQFRGKYVVVWKKIDGNWLMYLDIWNRSPLNDKEE